jgi:two-component system, NarL family, sensor kinase
LTLYQEAYELENIGSQLQISLLTNIELSAFKLGEYEIAHTALAKKFLLVDSIAVFDSRAALDSIQNVYAINDLKEQAKEDQLLSEQQNLKLSRTIGWLITALLLIFILVIILVQRRKYLKLQLSEAEKASQLALLQGISRGEDAERQRFAEELHDSLGSQIGALHLKLSSDNVDEEKLKQLESIGDDVRRISHDLLPPQIENGNLSLALEKLFLFNHSEECSFYFHSHNDLNSLGNAHFDLQLYRVFQELIRNTVKHSKAKEAHLSVWKEEEKWVFEYEDNGVGMPKNATPGLGTQTIQSRLNKIGASFHLDSKPNKGIRIGITVNLDHA